MNKFEAMGHKSAEEYKAPYRLKTVDRYGPKYKGLCTLDVLMDNGVYGAGTGAWL